MRRALLSLFTGTSYPETLDYLLHFLQAVTGGIDALSNRTSGAPLVFQQSRVSPWLWDNLEGRTACTTNIDKEPYYSCCDNSVDHTSAYQPSSKLSTPTAFNKSILDHPQILPSYRPTQRGLTNRTISFSTEARANTHASASRVVHLVRGYRKSRLSLDILFRPIYGKSPRHSSLECDSIDVPASSSSTACIAWDQSVLVGAQSEFAPKPARQEADAARPFDDEIRPLLGPDGACFWTTIPPALPRGHGSEKTRNLRPEWLLDYSDSESGSESESDSNESPISKPSYVPAREVDVVPHSDSLSNDTSSSTEIVLEKSSFEVTKVPANPEEWAFKATGVTDTPPSPPFDPDSSSVYLEEYYPEGSTSSSMSSLEKGAAELATIDDAPVFPDEYAEELEKNRVIVRDAVRRYLDARGL